MATGAFTQRGDKITWKPNVTPVEKRVEGGWYDNPDTGYNERWSIGAAPAAPNDVAGYLKDFQSGVADQQRSGTIVQSNEDIFNDIKPFITPAQAAPEVPKLLDTYQSLRTGYGVDDLESSLTELQKQERDIQAEKRIRIYGDGSAVTGELNKPVATNVIAGRVTEVERQENERLDAVNREIKYASDLLTTKYSAIKVVMDLTQTDYTNARQSYNDQFDQNISMFNLVRGVKQDQLTQQQKEQDNARANLQIIINSAKEGGIDVNAMRPDQKALIANLEVQSGLPIGFTSAIKADPKANIISTTSDNGQIQVLLRNPDGSMSLQTYGTKQATQTEKTQAAYQTVISQLNASKGTDNYVNTALYEKLKQQYPDVFKSYIAAEEYLNPNDATAKKFFQTSTQATNNVSQDLKDASAAIAAGAKKSDVRKAFLLDHPGMDSQFDEAI